MKPNFIKSPQSLVLEAVQHDGGRICFFYDQQYYLCDADLHSATKLFESFVDIHKSKYKIQTKQAASWHDCTKYKPVFDFISFDAWFAGLDFLSETPFPCHEATLLLELAPRRFTTCLRKILYNFVATQWKKINLTSAAYFEQFLLAIEPALVTATKEMRYFFAHARAYIFLIRNGLLSAIKQPNSNSPQKLLDEFDKYIERESLSSDNSAAFVAVSNLRGQILSLYDRESAALEFDNCKKLDCDLVATFYLDMGVNTYYGVVEVDTKVIADRVAEIKASQKVISDLRKGDLIVTLSVDPDFFRIYMPLLFFYAQQLRDIDFHIVLCADLHIAMDLVNDGAIYCSALARLNAQPPPENVSFSSIAIPKFCNANKTFYACARFFVIDRLLENYSSVFVMDADMTIQEDPRPFFASLAKHKFGLPKTKGLEFLSPWRRYMAGSVFINGTEDNCVLIKEIQIYLTKGLAEGNSWMLDQNALAFALETTPNGHSFDLNTVKRPMGQPSLRTAWEVNFRARKEKNDNEQARVV